MLALDVILLQELHVTEDKASRLAIPGFHCFAVARDAKRGGVAVFVRDALQYSLTSQSVSEVVEHTTVCVKVGAELSYFTSVYFPRGHKVSAAALSRLSYRYEFGHAPELYAKDVRVTYQGCNCYRSG
ncbi:Endonuclease/exonuclease/phosphatase [Perkinsela sp. CCAP 1560/4]|nr:Endonuclease/exonuclease/phosphatase [Perkinsela sp. CCAP 1560/4]|eukprot:KNH08039.1 Endonuclease/exonuclease/phosphatase [Perkinsela sp. CCAP 1560/4]